MDEAPGRSRNLRARLVQRLQGHGDRYECYWDRLIDQEAQLYADLGDHFSTQERWRDLATGSWYQLRRQTLSAKGFRSDA